MKKYSINKKDQVISIKTKKIKFKNQIFYLAAIVLLSIIVSMIPHLNSINKENQIIGVDTNDYVGFLTDMSVSSHYQELLHKVFVSITGGDRPFSLLFFYMLSSVLYPGNFSTVLEGLPFLLGPLFVIITYFLTLSITRDHFASLAASLIAIPSHILISIYGGLYANWFSLIWGYLSILFLFKLIDEPKSIYYIIFSVLIIALLLSHAQTWTIFMYEIGLFLVVFFLITNRKTDKKNMVFLFFSLLPSVIIEITRVLLINTSGVKQEIGFALQREVGIHDVNTVWHNLIATSHFTLAGLIGNPIILLLLIYWLFNLKNLEKFSVFIVIFFSLFIPPLLFGDQQIQSRFFYEIPFQVPAAIALLTLRNRLGIYVPSAICFSLIIMSIYVAANFVLVIH